ncbi:MAG TPA: ABC transporter substrate-binding protein, partial [Acidimicrobiales bacterium]|nr:ABC transporter substrate-binding protein [Acidimicrobiales bacterium]
AGGSPYKIALITSLTGPGASEFSQAAAGFDARIAMQNAKGGINGRKIKLVVRDDATNPSTNQTATQSLISQGVFGIIDLTPVAFGGYKAAQAAGVPVTGGAYDGSEWFQSANTNMFTWSGQSDPKDPQYDGIGKFVKAHGGTNCGSVGYSISPSSSASATGFEFVCQKQGLTKAFTDTSLPFGSVAVTSLALQLKAANVNAMWLPLDANTNFAIMTALSQAGVKMKVIVNATGYGQPLLKDTAALGAAAGAWFTATGTPIEEKTPGTEAFVAALKKYAHFSGVPDFSYYEGWNATDLMLYGLNLVKKNPTQAGFISALHKVSNYDAGGLGFPVSFKISAIGKAPTQLCGWYVQLKGDTFANPTEVCGAVIPGSDQLPNE